jgi:hypothetical protein
MYKIISSAHLFPEAIASSDIAQNVVSYLTCESLLSLTTSSIYIKDLSLESYLLTIRVCNLLGRRPSQTIIKRQQFIEFARKCELLLDLDLSYKSMATDDVVQGIVGQYKHLLSIDLKECSLFTDLAVHAVARHCPSLIKISVGDSVSEEPGITDAAAESIGLYCRHIRYIDFDETDLTDVGVQSLVSCLRLQWAHVGGTHVTAVGAMALAQRCSLACASAHTHVAKTLIDIQMGYFNVCLYRLNDDRLYLREHHMSIYSLNELFPNITVFGQPPPEVSVPPPEDSVADLRGRHTWDWYEASWGS